MLVKFKIQNLNRLILLVINVDIQYALAVILIILGIVLNQSGSSNPFYSGLGIGIIAMGTLWVLIRLIKELKKKSEVTK